MAISSQTALEHAEKDNQDAGNKSFKGSKAKLVTSQITSVTQQVCRSWSININSNPNNKLSDSDPTGQTLALDTQRDVLHR